MDKLPKYVIYREDGYEYVWILIEKDDNVLWMPGNQTAALVSTEFYIFTILNIEYTLKFIENKYLIDTKNTVQY